MDYPLLYSGKKMSSLKKQTNQLVKIVKGNHVLFALIMLAIAGSMLRIFSMQPVFYAHAFVEGKGSFEQAVPSIVEKSPIFSTDVSDAKQRIIVLGSEQKKIEAKKNNSSKNFEDKLRLLVGDSPIREMIHLIAKRDERTAAFLIGIAKKESSFGLQSPLKDGKTCYNYWGYKGNGGRGTGMGYACFASAEEAIMTVGDRLQMLAEKNHSTPAKMVDTWKCGKSCVGDPGAPGWVSTVAMYFNKIVAQNS